MTVWDVTRHGAVPDDGRDDTAAINRVINDLARPGDTVLLPAGTYSVTGTGAVSAGAISIAQSGITLAGAGQGETVVRLAAGWTGDLTGIVRTDSSVDVADVTIRDLTIDGADRPGNIKGLYVGGGSSGALHASILIERVEVEDVSAYAFDPHGRSRDVVLRDCFAHDSGWQLIDGKRFSGFTVAGVLDGLLIGNEAVRNGSHGFNLVGGAADIGLLGNRAADNAGNGIAIQRGGDPFSTHDILAHWNAAGGNDDAAIRVGELASPDRIVGDVLVGRNPVAAWDVDVAAGARDTAVNARPLVPGPFDAARPLYGDSGADMLGGGDGPDLGLGMGGQDRLRGRGGKDLLAGGSAGDRLSGGDAGDVLMGGSGGDALYGGAGGDVLMAGSGDDGTIYGGAGGDLAHGGSGHDELFGRDGDDILVGGSGQDRLFGGAGNDYLRGGTGSDVLAGGAGRDYFDFDMRGEGGGGEAIVDFAPGSSGDVLGIGALLTGYELGEETDFVSVAARSGGTLVSIDPDGAGAAQAFALVLLRDLTVRLAPLVAEGNIDFGTSDVIV